MIYVKKSEPAPACLSIEKAKKNGDYKCGDVLSRTCDDFYNKCYICGSKAPTTVNVEHFKSHRGNKDLMYDWYNLFYACGHCNNIKLHLYDHILNCTNPLDLVDEWIQYDIKPFPGEKVKLTVLHNDERVRNTVELLEKVYNGHTPLKTIEAGNIRQNLLKEIRDFQDFLFKYYREGLEETYKESLKREIESQLSHYAPFTAFKKWIIRENPILQADFGELV